MFIEPGTKILSGKNSPHNCTDRKYSFEKISGLLISYFGKRAEYEMFRCNKCGTIKINGAKVKENLFEKYRKKQSVLRVKLLNKFFDLMYQKSDECKIISICGDDICDYKDYTLTCYYKYVFSLRRDVGKHHYEF